jgi:hypothetical protein
MKKFNLPLTYEPKIQPVIDGTCRQTIRIGHKFSEGDLVSFHGWAGRPYHSSWSFRTPYQPLWLVQDIKIISTGFLFYHNGKFNKEVNWESWEMDHLAEYDGIVPATGEELHNVLMSKNKIPAEGIESQIIRW